MLVLSRKLGQGLRVGQDIEITVLRVEGDQVRLGIKAPREVAIVRTELLDEIRNETEAAQVKPDAVSTRKLDLQKISSMIRKSDKKS